MFRSVVAVLFAAGTALGLLGPSSTGFTFMKIGIGARPVGMGGAYTAIADDANALFWNPAGLALNPSYGGSVSMMQMLSCVSYASGGFVAPIGGRLAVGLAGGYLSATDTRRDALGQDLGDFGLSDLAVGPGVAWQPLTCLGFGAAAKYVYSRIDSFHASAFSVDGGAIYQPWKYVTFGASLLHLGPPRRFISDLEYPPVNLRAGVAGRIPLGDNRLILSSDLSLYPDYGPAVSAGAELCVPLNGAVAGQALYVRAGYQSGSHLGSWSGFSLGIGYEYKLTRDLSLGLDVVYLSYGLLGDSQRASLSLRYSPEAVAKPSRGKKR